MLEKTFESPLDCKVIKLVHPKGNQPWLFTGRTDMKLKLQYFGHRTWRADSLEKTLMLEKIEGSRRRGRQRMRWLDSITNSMDMSFIKLLKLVMDREAWHATSPWGRKESDTTEWLNWIELNNKLYFSTALVQNVHIKAYFIHPILKEVKAISWVPGSTVGPTFCVSCA